MGMLLLGIRENIRGVWKSAEQREKKANWTWPELSARENSGKCTIARENRKKSELSCRGARV